MVAGLVRDIAARNQHATKSEVEQLRRHFGETVLPSRATARVVQKWSKHVEGNLEWPSDTTAHEYLESLRATVLDGRSGIFLEYSEDAEDWTVYFAGRARRAWRGPASGGLIVVLFNGDRSLWVTGFQPEDALRYFERRNGFWILRRR